MSGATTPGTVGLGGIRDGVIGIAAGSPATMVPTAIGIQVTGLIELSMIEHVFAIRARRQRLTYMRINSRKRAFNNEETSFHPTAALLSRVRASQRLHTGRKDRSRMSTRLSSRPIRASMLCKLADLTGTDLDLLVRCRRLAFAFGRKIIAQGRDIFPCLVAAIFCGLSMPLEHVLTTVLTIAYKAASCQKSARPKQAAEKMANSIAR
jgi:hypothetical protein